MPLPAGFVDEEVLNRQKEEPVNKPDLPAGFVDEFSDYPRLEIMDEPKLWDKIKSHFSNPEAHTAKAQNIYEISQATGLPMREVNKNYEFLARAYTESEGIGTSPDPNHFLATLSLATIISPIAATSAVYGTGAAAIGIAGALAGSVAIGGLNKLIPTEKLIEDMELSGVDDTVVKTVETADFIGKALLTAGAFHMARGFKQKFFKQQIETYNLEKELELRPEQVRDIYQTGELTTPEQKSLWAALDLNSYDRKAALEHGISIKIPAEKIIRIVDNPLWAKVKNMFGKPVSEPTVSTSYAGKPTKAPSGLIEGPVQETGTGTGTGGSDLTTWPYSSKSASGASEVNASLQESPSSISTRSSESVISTQNSFPSNRSKFLSSFSTRESSQENLTRLYGEIQGQIPFYGQTIQGIAEALKAPGWIFRVKRISSLDTKLQRKEHKTLGTINDMIGGSLFVPEGGITKAKKTIKEKFPEAKLTTDFHAEPSFLGYNGVHYDIHGPNGQIFELQLFDGLDGLARKLKAHKIYSRWRKYIENNEGDVNKLKDILKKVRADGLTIEFRKDVERSRAIYSKAKKSPVIGDSPEVVQITPDELAETEKLLKETGEEVLKQGAYETAKLQDEVFFGSKGVEKLQKPSSKDPVGKLITALKKASIIRSKQETIYAEERSKKFGKLMGVRKGAKGEAGFYKELGALKGEFSKVEFEAIRDEIGQEDIDILFQQIRDSKKISEWDKVPAMSGLAKMFGEMGGRVPTDNEISLLNEVFGRELTEALLEKQPLFKKMADLGLQVANVPRSIMAAYDLSAPLRQGIFLIGRQKQFGPAFQQMFEALMSPKAYQNMQDAIISHPDYQIARESGLSLTDNSVLLGNREEQFMSSLAEQYIPGIKASGRAYIGFLNKLRFDVFVDMLDKAENLKLNPRKNRDLAKNIAEYINNATGRGTLPKALSRSGAVLNSIFFSPRLILSRINLLNPVTYIKMDPFVRKEALKDLFSFIGLGVLILSLAKLAGTQVGTESRSSDFGKIKIDNTRFDIWGGFQPLVRAASQVISGKYISSTTGKEMTLGEGYRALNRAEIIQRFFEGKLAPVPSFIWGFLKQQDAQGQPYDVPKEVRNRFIPMMMQDMYKLAKEDPKLLPAGLAGFFGVGVQTYKEKKRKTAL